MKDLENFHAIDPDLVINRAASSRDGLSDIEASKRLKKNGKNEIPKHKKNFFVKLAPQIFDFVILLLLGISAALAVLAFLFPDNDSTSFETSIAIVAVIFLSWVLIIIQMYSAERSLEALRKASAAKAKVKRNGKWIEIPSKDVVTGDIILLSEGDRVPADSRIISSTNLALDESSLTGESVSLEKYSKKIDTESPSIHEMSNMAFMSTLVTRGKGEGVVTATGKQTQLGIIASEIEEADEPEIPLQRKMSQLARTLSIVLLSLIFLLAIFEMFRQYLKGDLNMDSVIEIMVNSVILSVVAVPWSFPIITTTTMARGMIHLVKENAIVKRMASVEGLGRVSIICSDKTGTMTRNEMTITMFDFDGKEFHVSGSGYGPEGIISQNNKPIQIEMGTRLHEMILAGYLNNDAKLAREESDWIILGDPTEGAFKTLGEKANLDMNIKDLEPEKQIPFDSDRKMMTSVFRIDNELNVFSKGGPEQILEKCTKAIWKGKERELTPIIRRSITKRIAKANVEALRTLAIASKKIVSIDDDLENGLTYLGFAGMMDPPKEGVKEAVEKCHNAGIKVVMITGDSKGTASAIAGKLGILKDGDLVVEGRDLPLRSEDLVKVSVFFRVSPGQKVDIVTAYRERGQIIAMTGDGMNDAAALKNADVGVAMGKNGVDVAKEASQLVLSDDNFATLVTAVHRGRQIFDNIQKSITYQIYTNISELSIMFIGTLIFAEQLMGDKHLLFLYFSTHIFPVAALVLDRTTDSVMKEPPRSVKEGIVSRKVVGNLSIMVLTMTILSLTGYIIMQGMDMELQTIQTMILTFVVSAECINLMNSLSMKDSLVSQIKERNIILPITMAMIPISALGILMYFGDTGASLELQRLTPVQFAVSSLSGFLIIPAVELFKIFIRRSRLMKVPRLS